ncbi:hypothetical protein phiRKBJ001_27 [Streptomyces phage phiRKBJ001]|nr:hypothetical protein phiRKBJ001_27 [Streptomyces phage phiRKBJ001]
MRKLAGMRLTPDMMRDYTVDDTISSGFVNDDNTQLRSFLGEKVSGKTMIYLVMTWNGSDVTSNSAGNITDQQAGILPEGWRPDETYTGVFDLAGVAKGSVTIASFGLVTLKTLSATRTMTFGQTISMSVGWISQNN